MRVLIAGAGAPVERLKLALVHEGFEATLAEDEQQLAARLWNRPRPTVLLELGPFDPHRMVAAVLEACVAVARLQGGDGAGNQVACGAIRLDLASGAAYVRGRVLPLTPRELAFLREMMLHQDSVVPKESLHHAVYAAGSGIQLQALAVIAHRLRKKLAPGGVVLRTVRGLGYVLRSVGADAAVD